MEMFLTIAALSLLATGVSAALFLAAAGSTKSPEHRSRSKAVQPSLSFFGETRQIAPQVPVEVLLLQIERHVRLEQAAAESFVDLPTRELLHSRTASPLVH
jgi:hypothetical protein